MIDDVFIAALATAALAALGALWIIWRASRVAGAVCLALGLGVLFYAAWIEPRSLGVTRATIEAPRFQEPLRVALIADTQSVNYHWPARRLRALVDRVNAEKPDAVFLLGDYAGWSHGPSRVLYNEWFYNPPEETIPEFSRLNAPMGVYAVLGNHDWLWGGRRMKSLLQGAGAQVLINEGVLLTTPQGGRVWLGGADDYLLPAWLRPKTAFAAAPEGVPQIMITHRPDVIGFTSPPPDIAFAGHTHGGQICFPLIGCPIRMSSHGWDYGIYASQGRPLFVSRGVGTGGLPLRFMAPPEIVIIDITPAEG